MVEERRPTRQEMEELAEKLEKAFSEVRRGAGFKFEFVLALVVKRPDHPTAHAVAVASSSRDPVLVQEFLVHAYNDLRAGRYTASGAGVDLPKKET